MRKVPSPADAVDNVEIWDRANFSRGIMLMLFIKWVVPVVARIVTVCEASRLSTQSIRHGRRADTK